MKNKDAIEKLSGGSVVKNFIFDNKVMLFFIVLCAACIAISGASLSYISAEVLARFARNTCIVLALIIPCLAGLGMNFAITVGAMAAQISIFFIVHWGFTGLTGFMLCVLMCTPMAILFGWLVGLVYNKTKGAEMIAGLILGFFADGLYKLFTLYIIGGLIPYDDPNLLPRGFGLRNAFDLTGSLKYAIDDVSFIVVIRILAVIFALVTIVNFVYKKKKNVEVDSKSAIIRTAAAAVMFAFSFAIPAVPILNEIFGGERLMLLYVVQIGAAGYIAYALLNRFVFKKGGDLKVMIVKIVAAAALIAVSLIPSVAKVLAMLRISACTYMIIVAFCYFNNWILDTKLGQDMRTVGQNRIVARSAGINVDKIRIIATCISTVLAAWGQLIYLQNLGTFNTVQQQLNVGLYAVAAILVGGANVQKAKNSHAIIGVILFHTLFVVIPLAATKIFGDAAVSEYIRMFISYGVIAVSLAMHAWQKAAPKKDADAMTTANAAVGAGEGGTDSGCAGTM